MTNPLKDWQHRTKPSRLDTPARILPLKEAPEWLGEFEQWRVLFSKRLPSAKSKVPDLVGMMFQWEDTTYEVVAQELIADTEQVRELEYKHRHDDALRVYFYAYMEEVDPLMATIRGIRPSKK